MLARLSMVCTLGLDLGTSSAKAVVVESGGQVLAQASAGSPVTSAAVGYAESEPAHWWSAVTASTREAVDAAGARPAGVGLAGGKPGLGVAAPGGGGPRPAPRPCWGPTAAPPAPCTPTGSSALARWPGWRTRWRPA